MLQLNKIHFLSLALALLFSGNAIAGLYGIDEVNPYTAEEDQKDRGFPPRKITNYREEMRNNINFLTRFAKHQNPEFQIILHGDNTLFSLSEIEDLTNQYNRIKNPILPEDENEERELIENISAISVTNQICGENTERQTSSTNGLQNIYIEQCKNVEKIDKAIDFSIQNKAPLYVFADRENAFKHIKGELIIKENAKNVFTVKDAKNVSILVDDSNFPDKYKMIEDISRTNYDIVILKPLFHDKVRFTKEEINSLKLKKNGAKRLIIAEMNLSEISPKDYYWQKEWQEASPSWFKRKSFVEQDSMIVEYWNPTWRTTLSHHFKSILDIGFDGVWFTGSENYKYFEKLTPLI